MQSTVSHTVDWHWTIAIREPREKPFQLESAAVRVETAVWRDMEHSASPVRPYI
jgi:hypothetical protein